MAVKLADDKTTRLRSAIAVLLGLVAAVVLLTFVNHLYPLRTWLLRTLLCLWGWQLYLAVAFVAAGDCLVSRVLALPHLAPLPRLALAAPAGAVVFAFGMFLGGFLHLYGPVFAVLWPASMLVGALLLGGARSWRTWWREWQIAARPTSGMTVLATAFGTLALGLLYLQSLTPESLNYDAAWSHLVVAQDYAREGRIVPFLANWPATLPHLASLFYTWAFLVPGLGRGATRWMMALHTEMAFIVWTLVGVGAMVQVCLKRHVHAAWVAFFLFPGIFVYDNNPGGAADHILAFFAVPALMAALLGAETLNPRWWALFGIIAAGGLMTKFQSAYCLLPSGLLLGAGLAREAWRVFGSRQPEPENDVGGSAQPGPRVDTRHLWQAPLAALCAVVVTTAPHFVRNWVFYRNPLYPMAQGFFSTSRPAVRDAPLMADNIISHWGTKPPTAWGARLAEACELFWTFSFRPHAGFTGAIPVVGSLFTLTLPLVLLVSRGQRRLRIVVAIAAAAVFLWAFTYWVDRNLQGIVPLLAVATCALLVRTWHCGIVARVGVVVVVAAQLAWSGDHFFSGTDRITSSLALINSGYDGRAMDRFRDYRRSYVEMGNALPRDARVVLHSIHSSLGIDRPVLLDWPGMQGLIDPRTSRTPRELHDRYRALGITHVVYQPGQHPSPVKQDEVIFGALRNRYAGAVRHFDPFFMFELAKEPPPAESPYRVLVAGIGGDYPDGIYRVEDLATVESLPSHLQRHFKPVTPLVAGQVATQMDDTQALLIGRSALYDAAAQTKASAQFQSVVQYPQFQLFVRRP